MNNSFHQLLWGFFVGKYKIKYITKAVAFENNINKKISFRIYNSIYNNQSVEIYLSKKTACTKLRFLFLCWFFSICMCVSGNVYFVLLICIVFTFNMCTLFIGMVVFNMYVQTSDEKELFEWYCCRYRYWVYNI